MKPVVAVIRREYLQRVKNKVFIISTIGFPLLMVLAFAGPLIIESRQLDQGEIALVDETGILGSDVADRLGDGFEVEIVPASPTAQEELDARVESGELFGYLILDEQTLNNASAEFRGDDRPGGIRRIQLQRAIVEAALANRLTGEDADVNALLDGGDIEYVRLGEQEAEGVERAADMIVGFASAMVLYIVLILYGVQVMRSVLEEKTTRIVEVVISAMQPWELMLGKIIGVGAVGLTQLTIWVVSGVLLLSTGLPFLIAMRPELAELSNLAEYLPAAGAYLMFFLFFVMGYFLYSGLYAAVAAMCSTDEEAQQTQMPVTLMLIVPVMFLAPVMEDPNGPLSFWLSFVPFFSPVLMFPRYMGGAPLWQPLLSLVLIALTLVAVAWVAGRIYRVGILMQGKRPTLPELVRWVREA